MHAIATLLGALPLLSLAAATPLIEPRQAQGTQVVRIASAENIAARSNGKLLVTNMNQNTLYEVDPETKTSSTAFKVSGATGLSGIAEYQPDIFAVIGGKGIYKVDYSSGTPKSTLVKTITSASNLNGLSAFDNTTVLVADAGKGEVYKFNMNTGDYSVALKDATMAPSGAIPFGIDGIRYANGTVWYTNIFKNSFHKMSVDATVKATSTVTTLWTNLMGDDLCIGPNGKIYVTTNSGGTVVEVENTAGANTRPVAIARVTGSTACAFGRTAKDSNVIYVTGGQGVFSATVKL